MVSHRDAVAWMHCAGFHQRLWLGWVLGHASFRSSLGEQIIASYLPHSVKPEQWPGQHVSWPVQSFCGFSHPAIQVRDIFSYWYRLPEIMFSNLLFCTLAYCIPLQLRWHNLLLIPKVLRFWYSTHTHTITLTRTRWSKRVCCFVLSIILFCYNVHACSRLYLCC